MKSQPQFRPAAIPRRPLTRLCAALALAATPAPPALAQAPRHLRRYRSAGPDPDMSGVYADVTGKGSATAAEMAIADFGGQVLGKKIDLLVADHQNKADIAAARARVVRHAKGRCHHGRGRIRAGAGGAGGGAREKRVVVYSGPGTERITNDLCSPYSVHYTYDTWSLANTTARATVGARRQELVFPDGGLRLRPYAAGLGHRGGQGQWRRRAGRGAPSAGLVGLRLHCCRPRPAARRSSGWPTRAATRSTRSRRPANWADPRRPEDGRPAAVHINDIHAIGLEAAAGLTLTEAFYWDLNEQTRAWSKRYYDKLAKCPT